MFLIRYLFSSSFLKNIFFIAVFLIFLLFVLLIFLNVFTRNNQSIEVPNLLGKSIKKDRKKGKSTLINLLGYEKAYNYAGKLKKNILRKLKKHGKNAKDLTETIEFILGRSF